MDIQELESIISKIHWMAATEGSVNGKKEHSILTNQTAYFGLRTNYKNTEKTRALVTCRTSSDLK